MNGDDQTRLLKEIRDLLVASNEHAATTKDEYLAIYKKSDERTEAYSQHAENVQRQVYELGYKLGSMKIAIYVVGAVEVAIALWILARV